MKEKLYPRGLICQDKYPPIVNGKSVYDLESGKYLKMWQGPQHPGVTR